MDIVSYNILAGIDRMPSVRFPDGSSIWNGNNLDVTKNINTNTIDSIVTDPPYGLRLFGNKWDDEVPVSEIWNESLRVLKPGGYMLAFSSPRTYHRLASAIEDSGFEIKDQLMWIFGQGFPKSYKIGNGLGTALKPAHEPIVMARKPLSESSIVKNISKWGTGAINIEDCRVGNEIIKTNGYGKKGFVATKGFKPTLHNGRFPSNVIISDSAGKVIEGMRKGASKFFYCPKTNQKDKGPGNIHPTVKPTELMQYLVRLVTPAGGKILDGYFGSGSTGKACIREGFRFIGIEQEHDYFNMAVKRCQEELHTIPPNLNAA